jgi:rubrerythrin
MDYGMLQGAITSLKVAADIAVALNGIKTMSEVQAKAIELQQIILSAQSSALTAQSDQFTLLQEIRDLKEEVARVKAWDEEKQRYALVAPFSGAIAYALKKESAGAEPAHWICASCYENGRKSILNGTRNAAGWTIVLCPVCKSHLDSNHRGPVQFTYAEETVTQ